MSLQISAKPPGYLELLGNQITDSRANTIQPNTIFKRPQSGNTSNNNSSDKKLPKDNSDKLFSLYAISLQVLVLALLTSLTSYARANTNSHLPSEINAVVEQHVNYENHTTSSENQVTDENYVAITGDRKGENYLAKREQAEPLLLAALIDDEKRPVLYLNKPQQKTSWALAFDNDILAPGHRDRDYTYGLNFTYSGAGAKDVAFSLQDPLAFIDNLIGIDKLVKPDSNNIRENYSIETGFFGFTPKIITEKNPNPNDRPYSSLVYFSSSFDQLDITHNVAWKTTLTIGALGLGLVGELQNIVHDQLGGKEAKGWNNQISEGGELTGRYVIARQQYLEGFSNSMEVKSTVQTSIGYLTEASWSLSFRNGKILSPWSSFNPELISYGEKSTYTSNVKPANEHYLWAGLTIKGRAYNAFLQGQFRDSVVTYDHHELKPIVLEGWIGYTYALKEGYRFSYVLRGQTAEIKHGDGDRNVLWGGLILAKTI